LTRRLSVLAALAAGIFTTATHAIAMAGVPDYDSAIYIMNGRWLLEGIAPYRDFHLNKMPLILVPNAIFALARDPRFLPQVASLLCALATGAILARSKALARDPLRWLVFAVVVGLLGLEEFRQGGNYPETYATPLIALAWASLMSPEPTRRDLLLGGCAVGLLGLTKQTHAVYGVSLLALLAVFEGRRPGGLARLGLAMSAATGIVLLALAPFALTGLLLPLLRSTVLYWIHAPPILRTEGSLAERLLSLAAPIAPVLLLALIAVARVTARWIRGRGAPDRPTTGFLALLATACLLETLEQRLFRNPHYMLHAFVALSLAPWVVARSRDRESPIGRILLVALGEWAWTPIVTQALIFQWGLGVAQQEKVRLDHVAASVDQASPGPGEPLLVLGGKPQLYVASSRPCADPRIFTAFLLAQEAAKGPEGGATVRALLRSRPLVLVVVEPSEELDLLERYLPSWRDEIADLDRHRIDDSVSILSRTR
ncbi:MAG TPA: hypothetical protein VFF73_22865, partial [Planctomycetota bacterium]|nr:hypothetical protein [Planctomycetota bacterium]